MKKRILQISIILFIILTVLNSIFFIEIFQNKDLKEFYQGKELPDNYSEKEKSHMQEVKSLTNLSLILNGITLISIFLLRKTKINLKIVGKKLIIISILFLIGAIFFQTFFNYFHLIFFNTNNYLLPSNSILIQKYPLNFFRNRFLLFNFLILTIGIYFASRRITLKGPPQKP
jgi:integral membrane protein (TIGR01906 family)